jgi:hypothetical protein
MHVANRAVRQACDHGDHISLLRIHFLSLSLCPPADSGAREGHRCSSLVDG